MFRIKKKDICFETKPLFRGQCWKGRPHFHRDCICSKKNMLLEKQ